MFEQRPPFDQIIDPAELAELPDGTLLRWRAVPNDPTSVAVAFLRRTDYERDGDQGGTTLSSLWISPGNGWEPESVTTLQFPVDVILRPIPGLDASRLDGALDPFDNSIATDIPNTAVPVGEWPEAPQLPLMAAPQFETLLAGGTYPRDVALQAAAQVMAGRHGTLAAATVLAVAEEFAAWLDNGKQPDTTTRITDSPMSDRDFVMGYNDPGYFAGGTDDQK